MSDSIYLFLVFLIFLTFIAILIYLEKNKKGHKKSGGNNAKCDVHSCKSIDPVSDPRYNMQQIVKQSILLEEHMANKNKRCRDCITKHFLHIIGLAEEAQMLATNKINNYPLINECVDLYNKLFQTWLKNYDENQDKVSLYCCDELRNMRKRLIALYFFNDSEI
jgi:hypothetical protein